MTLAMAGRAGDRFGCRHVLNAGVALFGLASLFCGMSTNMPWMLTGRFIQGIAGGLIIPQVLATIHVSLSGRAHSNAIGIFGAVIGMSFLIGQVLGGWLVSADIWGSSWRSVFLINIPICLSVLVLGPRYIPQTSSNHPSQIDLSSTITLALAVLLILVPLALGPILHWSGWGFVLMLLGVILLPLFYRLEQAKEKARTSPLVPPSLLRLGSIRFGLILALLFFTYVGGLFFNLAIAFQLGLGMTSSQSGDAFVACGTAFFISSFLSARISARVGFQITVMLGCILIVSGLFWLNQTLQIIWPHARIGALIGSTSLLGFGQALVISSFFRIGLSQVPSEHAGSGSAVLTTAQQLFLSFGPAFYGAIQHHVTEQTNLQHGIVTAFRIQQLAIALLLMATIVYIIPQRWRMKLRTPG